MEQLIAVDFGFSVADGQVPAIQFSDGDLVLKFQDWHERAIEQRFVNTLAFRWAPAPSHPTPRDDATYELTQSVWLADEIRPEGNLCSSDFAHYIFCFNAAKVFEVVCRRVVR